MNGAAKNEKSQEIISSSPFTGEATQFFKQVLVFAEQRQDWIDSLKEDDYRFYHNEDREKAAQHPYYTAYEILKLGFYMVFEGVDLNTIPPLQEEKPPSDAGFSAFKTVKIHHHLVAKDMDPNRISLSATPQSAVNPFNTLDATNTWMALRSKRVSDFLGGSDTCRINREEFWKSVIDLAPHTLRPGSMVLFLVLLFAPKEALLMYGRNVVQWDKHWYEESVTRCLWEFRKARGKLSPGEDIRVRDLREHFNILSSRFHGWHDAGPASLSQGGR